MHECLDLFSAGIDYTALVSPWQLPWWETECLSTATRDASCVLVQPPVSCESFNLSLHSLTMACWSNFYLFTRLFVLNLLHGNFPSVVRAF